MSVQEDVKISELSNDPSLSNDYHLFLGVREQFLENGEINNISPYYSYAIQLSTFTDAILNRKNTVTKEWIFNSKENPPLQKTRFDPRNFCNSYIISSNSKRKDVINNTNTYSDNNTFFPNEYESTMLTSTNVTQYSIANLDYVDRMAALLYETWINSISSFISAIQKNAILPSKVGDTIFSTTLSSEALVRQYYGNGRLLFKLGDYEAYAPDTHWIQHKGDPSPKNDYLIVASESGVSQRTPGSDDGDNSKRHITKRYLKTHHHPLGSHSHEITVSGSSSQEFAKWISVNTKKPDQLRGGGDAWDDGNLDYAFGTTMNIETSNGVSLNQHGSFTSHENGIEYDIDIRQAFKRVYVWERTS